MAWSQIVLYSQEKLPRQATPVITVMDTSALLAKLHIAQMQAQQLTIGAPASVTIPGVADPVPAKVSLISPALDPGSTTVEVWLRIENPTGHYRVGTAVHATIEGRTVTDALRIPAEAVQTANDGVTKSVMVIAPDGAPISTPLRSAFKRPRPCRCSTESPRPTRSSRPAAMRWMTEPR